MAVVSARDISEVIDRIVAAVPAGDIEVARLIAQLSDLQQACIYTPPEGMVIRWLELANLLSRELGQPDTDWKRQIAAILRGQS